MGINPPISKILIEQSTLVKEENGFQYRDLNKKGKLDSYEDPRQPIMPYYGVPMDQTAENVGMSYNKAIITGLLREKYQ